MTRRCFSCDLPPGDGGHKFTCPYYTATGCTWLIQVPSGNPEPDSPEDLYRLVECGAELTVNEYGSFRCAAGHEHVSYADPAREAFEAELAMAERMAG